MALELLRAVARRDGKGRVDVDHLAVERRHHHRFAARRVDERGHAHVFQMSLALSHLPAQREIQQPDQQGRGNAPHHGGVPVRLERLQHRCHRFANQEVEPDFAHMVIADDALDAIGARDHAVAARFRRTRFVELALARRLFHAHGRVGYPGDDQARVLDDGGHAVLADGERVGKAGKLLGAYRHHHHARKAPSLEDGPCELDGPFFRDFALDRVADEQRVASARFLVHAKVLALAQVNAVADGADAGVDQHAVLIDDGHLEGQVAHDLLPFVDDLFEYITASQPTGAQVEQEFRHASRAAERVLAKSLRFNFGACFCVADQPVVLLRELVEREPPDEDQACRHAEVERRQQPAQPRGSPRLSSPL